MNKLFLLCVFMIVMKCQAQAPSQPDYYKKYNPAYHFYPSGDPTGLFYLDGLYYNNWGTAYSSDFVHWKYTNAALERNKISILLRDSALSPAVRDSIQKRFARLGGSGTIVIDRDNTSGFGKNGKPALVSLWHNQVKPWNTQVVGIAYSVDTAKTWVRYEKFPALDINSREFRDPKVFWYEPDKKWVMVIGWAEAAKIKFFSSGNLKDWELMSDFGPWGAVNGVWECADFFPLPVDGDPSKIKWVLSISVQPQNAQYFIGDFDGKKFTLDPQYASTLNKAGYVPEGELLFDFEHGIDQWSMEGTAFNESPAWQALFQQGAVMGFQGKYFVNSFHKGSAGIGKITSPDFTISKKYMAFLYGGTYMPEDESINLMVEGKIVRSQTGDNSGGMLWGGWDITEFNGKSAKIEIIDKSLKGAIYADHIMLTDKPVYTGRQKAYWIDYGADFFAVRSWNNYGVDEKRKIWTAWMGSWRYGGTEPVRGIQTVPRELSLKTYPDGIVLLQKPITELQTLRKDEKRIEEHVLQNTWVPANLTLSKNTYELIAEFENINAESFGIQIAVGNGQQTEIGFSVKEKEIYLDRTKSGLDSFIGLFKEVDRGPLIHAGNRVTMHIFVDNCSLEVFANNGETVLSSKFYPDPTSTGIQFFAKKGAVKIISCKIWELQSVDMGL